MFNIQGIRVKLFRKERALQRKETVFGLDLSSALLEQHVQRHWGLRLEQKVVSGGNRWGDWREVGARSGSRPKSWSSTGGRELGERIKLAWKNQLCISKTQLSRW